MVAKLGPNPNPKIYAPELDNSL